MYFCNFNTRQIHHACKCESEWGLWKSLIIKISDINEKQTNEKVISQNGIGPTLLNVMALSLNFKSQTLHVVKTVLYLITNH